MTRRERLEARAEKRRDWAASRDRKVAAVATEAEKYRGDVAFNTQPGHIPERARLNARQDRAFEDQRMAAHHRGAAVGIEQQLARTIFSDDENAAEALEAKAAALDADCERMKAANAAFRKAPGADPAAKLAGMVERGEITRADAMHAAQSFGLCHWQKQPFSPYELTNRRANARRLRERIKAIASQAAQTAKAEAAPGGVLVEDVGDDYARVTFPDYPGRDMVGALKAAGYHWSRPSWYGKRDRLPLGIEQG